MGDVIPFDPAERDMCAALELSVMVARLDVARKAAAAAKARFLACDPVDFVEAYRLATDFAAAADHLAEVSTDALRVFSANALAAAR